MGGRGGGRSKLMFRLIWSNVASMPNFSFLEGVILTIPGVGMGGVGRIIEEFS